MGALVPQTRFHKAKYVASVFSVLKFYNFLTVENRCILGNVAREKSYLKCTGCFNKSSPLKLLGIISLWLGLFA